MVVYLVYLCLSSSHLVCGANTIGFVEAEQLLEALLEVVREEAIEDWVGAGVDIGENDHGEVDCGGAFALRDDINQIHYVGGEERQPTNDEHQHDDYYHACHLAL